MFTFFILIYCVLATRVKSDNCPLINVEEAKPNDVDECLQNLSTQSLSRETDWKQTLRGHCFQNPDCEEVVVDCGQAKPSSDGLSTSLLCIWRNCLSSCLLMDENAQTCINSCFGLDAQCSNSQSVQEKLDCHTKLAKEKAFVKESKIICPLLDKTLDSLTECADEVHDMKLEPKCLKLGSICKYPNKLMDDSVCLNFLKNPWYDLRLFCAASICHRVCPNGRCVYRCLGSCKDKSNEDLLDCYTNASVNFYFEHNFYPFSPAEYYNSKKIGYCSSLTEVFINNDVRDCIQMTMTMDFDQYCKANEGVCQAFPDDCSQSKPRIVLQLQQGFVEADTTLVCLGYQCFTACRKLGGSTNVVLKCRMDCVGDIDKCSNSTYSMSSRVNCHIQESKRFSPERTNEGLSTEKESEKEAKKSLAVIQIQSFIVAGLSLLVFWMIAY